jgi:L-glyceraldehyde 3-phosphate reductase
MEESMGALDTAVRQGKALYAGISAYSPEETHRAASILRELGTPCLIHQPRYSMLDRSAEDGLFDVLEDEGIGCIPFSPLAQGLLTDKYLDGIPEDSRAAKATGFLGRGEVTEAVVERVGRLRDAAGQRGQSIAQRALAWVLRQPAVTSVLIGASRVGQIEEAVTMLGNASFTAEELQAIGRILE